MSLIFLSHSSANNLEAVALREWMIQQGWNDIFLDLDPERGLKAGERWQDALKQAAERCELVIFLVSPAWAASKWCLAEFLLARSLNKRIFAAVVEPTSFDVMPVEMTTEWQIVNLTAGARDQIFSVQLPPGGKNAAVAFASEGLNRLRIGLKRAGLDPRYFEWPPKDDPDRSPYPGLRPLGTDDAGIFFGREGSMVLALDRLRGLREGAEPRFFVIQGASGAGKSSFLRSGLIPRLKRDVGHFLPLPIVRPEAAVISGVNGLIPSIEAAVKELGQPINRADLEKAVTGGKPDLLSLLSRLAEKARALALNSETQPKAPSLVLSIDQGEELFSTDGAKEAETFLALLRNIALAREPSIIILVTIRSDSYERLQSEKALEGVRQETFSLPPMPQGAYQTIIEGPARRLEDSKRKLKIDPALTERLLKDIEEGGGKDALPLLAFTLERLYRQYGADDDLRLDEYINLGGIGGSIEAAVAAALKAANADPTIPKDQTARLTLLRRALIPWLATVDQNTRTPRRRVASLHKIPQEAQGLVKCLIDARLLATDQVNENGRNDTIVEPAHEMLLRQWKDLNEWLREDTGTLLALDNLQRAAMDWDAHQKSNDWLAHSAGRLEDAEKLRTREDFKKFLTELDEAYLQACRKQEDERKNRELEAAKNLAEEQRKVAEAERRSARRTRIFATIASALAVAAIGAALLATWLFNGAQNDQRKAEASLNVVRSRTTGGQNSAAYALKAYQRLPNVETRSALFDAGFSVDPRLEFSITLPDSIASDDDVHITAIAWIGSNEILLAVKDKQHTRLAQLSLKSSAPTWVDPRWKLPALQYDPEDEAEIKAFRTESDGAVYAARNNGAIELYRADGKVLTWQPSKRDAPYSYWHAAIGPGAGLVVFGGPDEGVFIHCAPNSASLESLSCAGEKPIIGDATAVTVNPEGNKATIAFSDGRLVSNGGRSGQRGLGLQRGEGTITALAASDEGRWAATLRPANAQAANLVLLEAHDKRLVVVAKSSDNLGSAPALAWWRLGSEILHGCLSKDLKGGPLCITSFTAVDAMPQWKNWGRLVGHDTAVDIVAISPNGTRVVSRQGKTLRIWRWSLDKAFAATLADEPPAGGWVSLVPVPASGLLLSDQEGRALYLDVDLSSQGAVSAPVAEGKVVGAASVPGGRIIAQEDKLIFIRDGESHAPKTATLGSEIWPQGGLIWTGENREVAVSLKNGRVGLINFAEDAPNLRLPPETPEGFSPFGLALDRKRKRLVVSSQDGLVHLFDLKTLKFLQTLKNTHVQNVGELLGAEGLATSADGHLLATTAANGHIMLYDLEHGVSRAYLKVGDTDSKGVAFDLRAQRLAAIDASGGLVVWSLEGSDPERWLETRLTPSRLNLPVALPTLAFMEDDSLVVLTANSEVTRIGLNEAAWIKRLVRLGYDKILGSNE